MFPFADNKNPHPCTTGFAGPEGSLKRAVGFPLCGLCADCKYIYPQQKSLGKLQQKSSSQGNSTAEFNAKKEKLGTTKKHPKVTLCDVARYCDTCSHSCGFELADVPETSAVHCFKRDMRAGFRFVPGCLRPNKHNSEEQALSLGSEVVPRVQSERSPPQHGSLTENQTKETVYSRDICHFLEGWTNGAATATCPASSLVGKHTKKRESRTSMWGRDVEEIPDSREMYGNKRNRLEDTIDGSEPSVPVHNCGDGYKSNSIDKEKTCSRMSDTQSCVELTLDRCNSFDSGNGLQMKPCGQIGESGQTQMSSELFCQSSDVDTDDPESFTCQRVRAYFRKSHFSCARTYMPWPFSNSGATLSSHAGAAACSADSTPSNLAGTPSSRHGDTLTNAPGETSSGSSHQLPPLSPIPFRKGGGSVDPHSSTASPSSPSLLEAVEKPLIHWEESQMTSYSSTLPINSDCSDSCESTLNLAHEGQENENIFLARSPPTLKPYYETSPFNHQFNILEDHCEETNSFEFMLLPLLSPVTSPLRHSQEHKDRKHEMLPEHLMLQTGNSSCHTCEEKLNNQNEEFQNQKLDEVLSPLKTLSYPSSVGTTSGSNEEDSWDETDCECGIDQDNKSAEQGLLENKLNTVVTSGVLTEACSSHSSDEDHGGVFNNEGRPHLARAVKLIPFEIGNERASSEVAGDKEPRVLDEFTAYEQDILLVHVIQDDPDLFKNLPAQSLLKLGPTRVSEGPKTRTAGGKSTLPPPISVQFEPK